ncbi:MAG: hypothetical protein C5B51_16320 [Terriglobia bacterium]|nr:MAG: hypothetical protein C5B51_16320 [Terriglobia bacterium]
MSREEAERLLGGYAAGTLTAAEQEALCAAALDDQQLFEALVREEPLRELLQDAAARAQLLAALDTVREPWYYRKVPWSVIAAATAVITLTFVAVEYWPQRQAPPITVVATAPLPQFERSPLPTNLKPFLALPQNLPLKKFPALPIEPPPALPAPAVSAALSKQPAELDALLPSPAAASVEGAVRDATQAGVSGATVTLTNQVNAGTVQARTNERGEYRTPPVSAGEYSLSIEAPGFQRFNQSGLVLRAGESQKKDAVLELGTAAESVQVAAAAPPPPAPALRRTFEALERRPAVSGLRYQVLVKQPAGGFAEVDAARELDRKDEAVIRFESTEAGYLYVLDRDARNNWQLQANLRITPAAAVNFPQTGAVRGESAGSREFFVVFSRVPLSTATPESLVPPQAGLAGAAPGRSTSGPINVAQPDTQRTGFPITLRYK